MNLELQRIVQPGHPQERAIVDVRVVINGKPCNFLDKSPMPWGTGEQSGAFAIEKLALPDAEAEALFFSSQYGAQQKRDDRVALLSQVLELASRDATFKSTVLSSLSAVAEKP